METQLLSVEKEFNICNKIIEQMKKVIIGKDDVIRLLLTTLLSNGHILIEDVPGVGKTTVAAALAKATSMNFKRVQLTPDVMASDITGFTVLDKDSGEFVYRPGVVMTNILIADEINRTSPKTQSALLEAMEERQVTVDGVTRALDKPFMVIATQNPVGFIGTYPLPESQLDRFLMKTSMGYPNAKEEYQIISDRKYTNPLESIEPVTTTEDILNIQAMVQRIHVDPLVGKYIVDLIMTTRHDSNIMLAASPRASIALMRCACANALLHGRNYCVPADVNELFELVVGHRIVLSPESKLSRISADSLLKQLKQSVRVPLVK
jgi:moxR-like ATPases